MHDPLGQLIAEWAGRSPARRLAQVTVASADPWQIDVAFRLEGGDAYRIHNVDRDGPQALQAFAALLGLRSRHFFAPYPWADAAALDVAFAIAIRQAACRVDASYLLWCGADPVAHFFLWKASANPLSQPFGVQVPELGIAVADAFQGRGLGALIMHVLRWAAGELGAGAVALTTALDNEPAYRTYLAAGYEEVGEIFVPLGVDVTAALAGEATVTSWRLERQMMCVLDPGQRPAVLAYLARERAQAQKLVDARGPR